MITFTVKGFFSSIYASFLIATLFGMQKIAAPGAIAVLIDVQAVFSIIVILILMDKLFQKYVAKSYHEVSSQDRKINTIMLMMSIYRNDVDKLHYELKFKTKRHITEKEIESNIDGLYVAFLDVEKLFSSKNVNRHIIKDVQYLMLIANIEDSLEKLSQFINQMNRQKFDWKDKSVDFWLNYILETAEKITIHIDESQVRNPKILIAADNIRDNIQRIRQALE